MLRLQPVVGKFRTHLSVDQYVFERLRRFLARRHKVQGRGNQESLPPGEFTPDLYLISGIPARGPIRGDPSAPRPAAR